MFSSLFELGKPRNFLDSLKDRQKTYNLKRRQSFNFENGNQFLVEELSAKTVLSKRQKITLPIIAIISIASFVTFPATSIFIYTLLFGTAYIAVILFRAAILRDFDQSQNSQIFDSAKHIQTDNKYSVLVALYKEAGQVSDLVSALKKIKWPRSQLEIFLICEEEDAETIAAIKLLNLPHYMSLAICPIGTPQTKPRALNYALQFCSGDYLVIYDAEDRPHPDQFLEAHTVFSRSSSDLVCLQAPLVVDNVNESWLTKMFSIEYTTLFSGILHSLSHWAAPMPLGGTSNHFKTKQLLQAGAWDAYNVTEDADLGIRLARMGYRCGTINSPTYEEAPVYFKDWLPQRTRWVKGWMQTLLVNLRSPIKLYNALGWRNFFMLHFVLTSVVLSVIIHPVVLFVFFVQLYNFIISPSQTAFEIAIIGISTFTLMAGYLTYGFLALAVTKDKTFTPNRLWIFALPAYWLLISVAGWRAIFQLFTAPHKWEKTEHGNTTRITPQI